MSKYVECVRKFLSLRKKLVEADQRIVEIVVHPEVSEDELREMRKVRMNIEMLMEEAVTALRKAYPPEKQTSVIGNGWNDPCYDRYDRELRPKKVV